MGRTLCVPRLLWRFIAMKKDFKCADHFCSDYNFTYSSTNLTCRVCNKFCKCIYCEHNRTYTEPCTEPCERMIRAGKDWTFDKPY